MQSGIGPMQVRPISKRMLAHRDADIPTQGQANHFYRYASKKIQYGIDRYQTETKRLYRVLNSRLEAQEAAGKGLWVVGGKYTIADLCIFSWVRYFVLPVAEWYKKC